MQLDVNVVLTLVVAIVVLLVGRLIVARVAFLNRYSIPDPVVGGLIAAVVITALRFGAGVQISFDMSLQSTLLLAFFSTIGLSADVRMLAQGRHAPGDPPGRGDACSWCCRTRSASLPRSRST